MFIYFYLLINLYSFFSFGREYTDPYLGQGIGPISGYGQAMYRSAGYQRFTPY